MPATADIRHPWPVRLWHWLTTVAIGVLLLTGLLLFDIHPRLYWGDDGHEGAPAFLSVAAADRDATELHTELQVGSHRWNVSGRVGMVSDDGFGGRDFLLFAPPGDWDFGATRGWHFLFAWLLVGGGAAYAAYLLASGRLARMWWPSRAELTWRSVASELRQHVRLQRARGAAARRYNLLQKLSYLVVTFVLLPAAVLSGLTMSNSVTAAWPWLFMLFGGRQAARSVHFVVAMLLLTFVLVHVFEVFVAGFVRSMRGMLTGKVSVEPGENG